LLLAVFLAMPYFNNNAVNAERKGWLLIPKENFKEAYQTFKPKADSLLKAGFELHYFNSNFKKAAIEQALADTISPEGENTASYWSLLTQLNRKLPAQLPVYLFTTNSLNHFGGVKPNTGLKLKWFTYTPKDSAFSWIKKAWFTQDKNVRIIVGNSTPASTVYNVVTISSGGQKSSPYNISVVNGKPQVSKKDNTQPPVAIDTAVLSADIYTDNNLPDGGYVKAALQGISEFTQYPINITMLNGSPVIAKAKKNWLFWLSEKPLDKQLAHYYNHILTYEKGKISTASSWVNI
jgi:hypothetical protein